MDSTTSFIKVNTEDVLKFILAANQRIIFAKPAFLGQEIEALIEVKATRGTKIDLYMEPGDKAIRLGFGDKASLELIHDNGDCFNIQLVDRIRMAILCVDNNALLYGPTLSFAEAETMQSSFANGILCKGAVADDIIKQFPDLEVDAQKSKKVKDNLIKFPGGYTPDETIIKLQDNVSEAIGDTLLNLKTNPAVDPTQLQKISVYRNKYKIVQQTIYGIRIENKRINLKPFIRLLPTNVDRLRSSWNVFNREDIDALQDTKTFWIELKKLEEKYKGSLLDAGRFGKLLDTTKKADYVNDVTELISDFKAYWGDEPSDEVMERFAVEGDTDARKSLKEILDNSRHGLVKYLASLCPKNEDFLNIVFRQNRHLREIYGKSRDEQAIIMEFVYIFVLDKLRFPSVDDIINTIDIKTDFYDVSDELLKDKDFADIIEKHELHPRLTSLGYKQVDQDKL